jgi:hypothetical protein
LYLCLIVSYKLWYKTFWFTEIVACILHVVMLYKVDLGINIQRFKSEVLFTGTDDHLRVDILVNVLVEVILRCYITDWHSSTAVESHLVLMIGVTWTAVESLIVLMS